MVTEWKRFTSGALVLASLSLFLFGCGSGSLPSRTPASKTINGIVSDSTTGQAIPNAIVTAYAINGAGQQGSVISSPETTRTDGRGYYVLTIPQSYTGRVLVEAELAGNIINPAKISLKHVAMATTSSTKLRAITSDVVQQQTVMLSIATEMLVKYIEVNKGGSFTPENIQKATLVLEPFLGPGFAQVKPPAVGETTTPAQENLLVMTKAISTLLTNLQTEDPTKTLADLVNINASTNQVTLGGYLNNADPNKNLTRIIATTTTDLINTGLVASTYAQPVINPIPEPPHVDSTPPPTPQNLIASSTSAAVSLSWDAGTGTVTAVGFNIYRDGTLIYSTADTTITGYADNTVTPGTSYTYEVKSRSESGILSAAASITVTTKPILYFTISGKVTDKNGSGVPSVSVTATGNGSRTVLTGTDGSYTFTGAREGSYLITPSLPGHAFTPASITAAVTTADVTGKDFLAVATSTVSAENLYPPGTIVGGVTYPNPTGVVIGGVTYTTSTVVGGVTYPTGTVIGGIKYPNGVVIGGVTYPAGTVVGGVAFPPSVVNATNSYPNPTGVVIGNTSYPTGTVTTVGTLNYPTGVIISGSVYASGLISATTAYPAGTIVGGISYPNPGSVVIGGVTYPSTTSTVIGGVTYPTGTVIGGIKYPNGVIIGGVTYPAGTVVGGVAFPPSVVIAGTSYPNPTGVVIGSTTYASGTVTTIGTLNYPTGVVIGGVTYPTGIVSSTLSYPPGTVVGGVSYPNPGSVVIGGVTYPSTTSTVVGGITFATGTVIGGITYPNGVVIGGVSYPAGTVVGGVAFPASVVNAAVAYPNPSGVVIGSTTYPTGTVVGGVINPTGTAIGTVTYPTGVVIGSSSFPSGIVYGSATYPAGTILGVITYSNPGGEVSGGTTYTNGSVTGTLIYSDTPVTTSNNPPTGL